MIKKTIIPLYRDEVAPRFDLATEVQIITTSGKGNVEEERTVVLPRASAEELCHLILAEHIDILLCGAIEDEYYQFLTWKKIEIYDSISGPWKKAHEVFRSQKLKSGDILWDRTVEGQNV